MFEAIPPYNFINYRFRAEPTFLLNVLQDLSFLSSSYTFYLCSNYTAIWTWAFVSNFSNELAVSILMIITYLITL